jgi:hypothetical protein
MVVGRPQARVVLWCCLIAVGLAPVNGVGMVVRMDNAELVSRSDAVVYGTVENVRLETDARVALVKISAVMKGAVAPNSTIRVSFSPAMSESPSFAMSERVLLFLRSTGPDTFQTVGGAQGKFLFK